MVFVFVSVAAVTRCQSHEGHVEGTQGLGAIYPRLSKSGDEIACSYQGAIWRLPAVGGVMTRLTAGKGFDIQPAWCPDGSSIAYIETRAFLAGQLRVVDAADGAPLALPREIVVQGKLDFDARGDTILGNFQNAAQNFALAWYDLRTGELGEPIRAGLSREPWALSNDGQWIAFATSLDVSGEQGGNNGPHVDVWRVAASGGEPQLITRFPARIYDLCWASDDQSLVIVSDLGNAHNNLWQLPLSDAEKGAKLLTFGAADEDGPSVSRDDRWLLFTDNRHGSTALVRRDLQTGRDVWLEVSRLDYRQPVGSLEVQVVDKDSGQPVTARVWVQHTDGKFHAPVGSLYRLLNNDMHFYAEGREELAVPVGQYSLAVARGPEYRIARRDVEIRPGETTAINIEVERWTDQRQRGWYSGENHIHANYGYGHWYNSPRTMLAQCAGEDLLVCNFMVANSDGDGVFDREYFRGRPDPLSTDRTVLYWNEEFRSTIWGHMTLLNLKQLVEPIFTGFRNTTNPHDHPTNSDVADHTHDQGGHVNYTHPAQSAVDPYLGAYTAKELPVDVALGKVDSIDVMGSNHVANMPLWYRLLNCGFHIPASAGTDCFLNRIASRLPGSDRAYVKIDGEFTYDAWITNLKAGRSFVTNGPMLEFTANGQGLGETLRFDTAAEVHMQTRVRSQYLVNRVELISNGEAIATADDNGDGLDIVWDRRIQIPASGWIAIRVSGPRHPDQSRGDVFAHTSPIYVEIQDRPLAPREDAEYFLGWIDRLWETVRQRNRIPPRHQVDVESQISAARSIYRKLAGQSD